MHPLYARQKEKQKKVLPKMCIMCENKKRKKIVTKIVHYASNICAPKSVNFLHSQIDACQQMLEGGVEDAS